MARVAINGFGRIGRAFLKLVLQQAQDKLDIVAINDLGDPENLAYLLRFDSVYGRYKETVEIREKNGKKYLSVGGKESLFIQEKDPAKLPWADLKVDIVVEATGMFESFEKAGVHKQAGAKRVVLTAPAKDAEGPDARTILMGVNDLDLKSCSVSSNGSCTTNSASPVVQVLVESLGIRKAFLNTVHGYTVTQNLIDGAVRGHDFRRGRAAGVNIVPSTTGATISVARTIPEMEGKFDGMSMRVPTVTGSLSAITFVTPRPTTVEEVNNLFKEAEKENRWKGILKTTTDPIVSSDIIGDPYAAIVDLSLTRVVDGDLGCVFSWYDNEFGYTNTLVEHVLKAARLL